MRRILSVILILVLCLSLTVVVSAEEPLVYDDADLLTAQEEQALEALLRQVSDAHNAQIIVGTVDSTENGDADYMVEALYDGMEFGYGSTRSGVFLLVCMDIREYRILSNGLAGDAIGGRQIDDISDAIVSDLSGGDYADAFTVFAKRCDYYLEGYQNGYPFEFGKFLLIALAVGLTAGLITVLIMKSQLKSVRQQHQANVYVKSGSLHLTRSSDIYLYRNVTRTRRQTSSSSGSGSGGSRHIGGGRF